MESPRSTLLFWVFVPPLVVFYLSYTLQLHILFPRLTDVNELRALLSGAFFFVFKPPLGSSTWDELVRKVQEGNSRREPFVRHIVAVGDLHGDMPNARKVLQFSGVTDDFGNWSGNVDFFVQTGDIIDRGDDTIALFDWMDQLRSQAAAVGGTMLSHLGNHEWMNAIGDWRYVYPTEIKTFGTVTERQKFITTGRIGRTWAANYTTASRLPLHPSLGPPNSPFPPESKHLNYQKEDAELDNSYYYDSRRPLLHSAISFVHGGLSPTYQDLTPFPTRINELSDSLLKKLQTRTPPPPHPPAKYPGLPDSAYSIYIMMVFMPQHALGSTQAEKALYDSNGPVWYRGWALDPEEKVCADVEPVLAKTGTRRMIMGHTPDFENIQSRCNGKVIIIDTGISHAYGGVLSAVSIHYTLTPIGADEEKRWIEKEVVSALYPDKQEILVVDEREVVGDFPAI
ncbi:hypothetical protein C0995_000089 [Termitomyces sp. Mi166|nr:hypothetical protein C0995_000089 [Termitomyces sp. Mi166\